MALSGPVLVVAEETNEVCEALTRGGNLPMREVAPAEAVAAIAKVKPSAAVLAACSRLEMQRGLIQSCRLSGAIGKSAPLDVGIGVLDGDTTVGGNVPENNPSGDDQWPTD